MKSIPPEVYEQWDMFEDDSKDTYVVKRNLDLIPIEVLQEIRAELTKYYVDPYNRNAFRYTTVSLLDVLDLIDKNIKEYTNETDN